MFQGGDLALQAGWEDSISSESIVLMDNFTEKLIESFGELAGQEVEITTEEAFELQRILGFYMFSLALNFRIITPKGWVNFQIR